MRDGTVWRRFQAQGGGAVVAAGERRYWRGIKRGWGFGADIGALARSCAADKKRIKELERELLRKDKALAETAALLVLSKKVAAIFNKGEAE